MKSTTVPVRTQGAITDESALHLVCGDDEFAVEKKARALATGAVSGADCLLGLEVIDGQADTGDQAIAALRNAIIALRTVGFLGEGKTVWLRRADFLGGGGNAGRAAGVREVEKALAAAAAEMGGGQRLIVSCAKADSKGPLYAVCKKRGHIHEFSVPSQAYKNRDYVDAHVREELARLKMRMRPDALGLFVERVGTEARRITGELEKLSAYLCGNREARLEDVHAVISFSRESKSWDLSDAVAERRMSDALKILRRLLFQKESSVGLVLSLERKMNQMLLFRKLLDAGWARAAGNAGAGIRWSLPPEVESFLAGLGRENPKTMHPYRAGRLAGQAAALAKSEIVRLRDLAMRAHEDIVSCGPASEQLVLEILVVRMTMPKPRQGGSGDRRSKN